MGAQRQSREFPAGGTPTTATTAPVRVVRLANAAAVVGLAAYLLCALVAAIAPDFFVAFFQPWAHGLTLAPLRPADAWFRPGEFLVGLVTFTGAVWLVSAAWAWVYRAWSR